MSNVEFSSEEPIVYTCSLGNLCHSSMMLKNNGLKRKSYPFDWVKSDLEIVLGCIKDDFSVFLDKQYYSYLEEHKAGHRMFNEYFFAHHNPLTIPSDYEYFKRCCQRFNELLRMPERKLFIVMFLRHDNDIHKLKESVRQFNKEFKNHTDNYTILAILQFTNQKQQHLWEKEGEIDFLSLYTYDMSWGEKFKDSRDEDFLNRLIKSRYTYALKQY